MSKIPTNNKKKYINDLSEIINIKLEYLIWKMIMFYFFVWLIFNPTYNLWHEPMITQFHYIYVQLLSSLLVTQRTFIIIPWIFNWFNNWYFYWIILTLNFEMIVIKILRNRRCRSNNHQLVSSFLFYTQL